MKFFGFATLLSLILFSINAFSQPDRWQQKVDYQMKIDFDVDTHQFTGEQKLQYWNNSPDTLDKVFYHLYFNAFQPNSMMDVRSRTILDPSPKIGDKIASLSQDEIGYHKILELTQDGELTSFSVEGTILEVDLAQPLLPGASTILEMTFESQVPLQIRRSGRDNQEGIDYSMSQWYPKLCEYDYQGWHANPYIGGEFYGVWGDFDVEIILDSRYTMAAGGILKNAEMIGRGYTDQTVNITEKKTIWKWEAKNVHDFVWAADRDYVVKSHMTDDDVKFYFVYQEGENTTENWRALPEIMDHALTYINNRCGKYPYPVFYFIQGGDGGMEYPMATLITGERSMSSLVGVAVHEILHSWYHMILATNESLYAWMDEGFTSFVQDEVLNHLQTQKLISGKPSPNPHVSAIKDILNFDRTGMAQPMSIHSDHFVTNMGYSRASYTKGKIFLTQLKYIVGDEFFYKGMLKYFNTWKFKHPNVNDFIRIMEKTSGLELDWFKEYFINTTFYPDYSIQSLQTISENTTRINLRQLGLMPMPLDVVITYTDGTQTLVNIPLRIMRGNKPIKSESMNYILEADWPWTHPTYSFSIEAPLEKIKSVEIDQSQSMIDYNRSNNKWVNQTNKVIKSE